MSFIPKNPLIMPEIESNPSPPQDGTRGIFPKKDGWYEIDSDGKTKKLGESGGSGGGSSIVIDTELSETSENPVQNKVINGVVQELINNKSHISHKHKIADIDDYVVDEVLDETSENPVQNQHITSHISALMKSDASLSLKIDKEVKSIENKFSTINEKVSKIDERILFSDFDVTASKTETPFVTSYDKEKGEITLNSNNINGNWSICGDYTKCFSYEVDAYDGVNVPVEFIFAQTDDRYIALNISHSSDSLSWFGSRKDIMKETGAEYVAPSYTRNTYLERIFDKGEKILVMYKPNITVTVSGTTKTVNRFIIYRKKITDVSFRQFMVFDLPTNATPVLGFYSYSKIVDRKIKGLYIDVDIPKYPVYDGCTLINNGNNDYVLEHSAKQWLAIGDSITGFSEASCNDKAIDMTDDDTENSTYGINYINFVEAITGYQACRKDTGNNYGYSGYAIAGGHGYATLWSRRTDWDNVKTNLVTLFAGTNDYYYGSEIGTIDDYISNTGINTIYGALRLYIDYFKEKGINGDLDIVLITPIQRFTEGYSRNDANTKGYYLEDYVNAIKAVGAYESLKVIDLYNNGGIGSYNYTAMLKDGLHPNKQGYEIIARKLSEGFLSVVPAHTERDFVVDVVQYDDGSIEANKTYTEILVAINDNKNVFAKLTSSIATGITSETWLIDNKIMFSAVLHNSSVSLACNNDNSWGYSEVPLVPTTNNNYPYEIVDASGGTVGIKSNTVTYLTNMADTALCSLQGLGSSDIASESVIIVDLSSYTDVDTIPTVTFNANVKWYGEVPELKAGKRYMFSFLNVFDGTDSSIYMGIGGEFN